MVSRSKAAHEPHGNDPLQRCDGGVRQTGEQSVAVVKSRQHKRCHDVGGNITTDSDADVIAGRSKIICVTLATCVCTIRLLSRYTPRLRTDSPGCSVSVPTTMVLLDCDKQNYVSSTWNTIIHCMHFSLFVCIVKRIQHIQFSHQSEILLLAQLPDCFYRCFERRPHKRNVSK